MAKDVSEQLNTIFYKPDSLILFPFKRIGKKYSLSIIRMICAISVSVFCAGIFFPLFTTGYYNDEDNNLWLCYKLEISSIFFGLVVKIFVMFFSGIQVNDLSESFVVFDKYLEFMSIYPKEFQSTEDLKVLLPLFLATLAFDTVLGVLHWDYEYEEVAYYNIWLFSVVIITHQVYGILSMIEHRYALLLKTLIRSENRFKEAYLSHMAYLDNALSKICSAHSRIYGSQMLVVVPVFFIHSVVNCYFVYAGCLQFEKDEISWYEFASRITDHTLWSLDIIALTVFIVSSHEKVKKRAKEFDALLYQLAINDKNNEISKNTKLRLAILSKREIVFTAGGFFTIDCTLVHHMIASAATYLVILIQFGPTTLVHPQVQKRVAVANVSTDSAEPH